MATASWPNIKAIREEMHLSQTEVASLLGCSVRMIQSVEQGWRHPSGSLEKHILLALIVHRHGRANAELRCWDVMGCSPEQHENCLTYRSGQGSLCWFLVGNKCTDQRMSNWAEKKEICRNCKFFQKLLPDPAGE